MKSGDLNFLEPYGPLQACNGTALPSRCNIDRISKNLNASPRRLNNYLFGLFGIEFLLVNPANWFLLYPGKCSEHLCIIHFACKWNVNENEIFILRR